MLAVNYSTIRSNLKDYCDKATDENETIIVTRKDEKNVVLISLEQYNEFIRNMKNTEYLKKLYRAFKQLEDGKVVVKTIEELDAMTNE